MCRDAGGVAAARALEGGRSPGAERHRRALRRTDSDHCLSTMSPDVPRDRHLSWSGRLPSHTWKFYPARQRRKWLDQIRTDSKQSPSR